MSTPLEDAWLTYLATKPGADSTRSTFEAGWYARQGIMGPTLVESGLLALYTPDDIYAKYPLKVGKQAALKAIRYAFKTTNIKPSVMLKAVEQYAAAVAQWPEADKKFIPHPATWFNRGSYDDDPAAWVKGKPVHQSQFSQSH